MSRSSAGLRFVIAAAALALPASAHAQAFKVDKFDIKGDGGTDYLTAEPGTGRVFVSRGSPGTTRIFTNPSLPTSRCASSMARFSTNRKIFG